MPLFYAALFRFAFSTKSPKYSANLSNPVDFLLKNPLVSKMKSAQEIIIAIMQMPKWCCIVPGNFCKVTITICYSVVFKIYWYWIHGYKIKSPLLETKGLLISNLSLYNSSRTSLLPIHLKISLKQQLQYPFK